jgi:eukaryotic-like serine/threonine-protein kinase
MNSAERADRAPEIQRLLDQALDDQKSSWSRSERTLVEDYLAREPALRGDSEAVLDLIYQEFLLRKDLQEALDPNEFCTRFPELAEALLLQLGLDAAITMRYKSPAVEAPPSKAMYAPKERIGDYQIMAVLGRGGMGVVYKAHDLQLVRMVAIKMIAAGRDASSDQLDRFRSEAQAVARLRHPNIIAVHAIGEHENQPYLSLELAAGGSLAKRLAEGAMAPREAAQIVETLARAVHAAHEAGVVHRDLKPSNILLTADGVPKVSDFGLAKLLDSDSRRTLSGEPLGTPSYMSAEQAAGKARRVGPAVDVYALGAILFQALTGRPPFLGESALDTLKLVISTEVVVPRRLRPDVPRDLETICLKCLEKEPSKRYASALLMADDLRRFLGHLPVVARPVGTVGRLWRWGRRNPWVAALSAAVLGSLIVGMGVSVLLAIRAIRAEGATRIERDRAQAEAEISKAVKEFLQRDMLAQASAFNQSTLLTTPDPDLKVRTALDRAALMIGDRFAGKPVVEASIRQTVGETYYQLGLFPQALVHLERALELRRSLRGGDDPDTLIAMKALGALYLENGKLAQAEALLDQAAQGLRKARSYEDPDALETTALLGVLYHMQGKIAEAEAVLTRVREVLLATRGPDDPKTLEATTSLGMVFLELQKPDLAERTLTDTLSRSRQKLGADHPFTFVVKLNLFDVYDRQGRHDEAATLMNEVIDFDSRVLGRKHPDTLRSMVKLGCFYALQGVLDRAEPLLSEALVGCRTALDRNHETTEAALAGLADVYSRQQNMKRLGQVLIEATEISRVRWGHDDGRTLAAARATGMFLLAQRDYAESEPYLRESARLFQNADPGQPDRCACELQLGVCLLAQNKCAEAQLPLLTAYNGLAGSKAQNAPAGKARLGWLIDQLSRLRDDHGLPLATPLLALMRIDPAFRVFILDLQFPADPFATPSNSRGGLQSTDARPGREP